MNADVMYEPSLADTHRMLESLGFRHVGAVHRRVDSSDDLACEEHRYMHRNSGVGVCFDSRCLWSVTMPLEKGTARAKITWTIMGSTMRRLLHVAKLYGENPPSLHVAGAAYDDVLRRINQPLSPEEFLENSHWMKPRQKRYTVLYVRDYAVGGDDASPLLTTDSYVLAWLYASFRAWAMDVIVLDHVTGRQLRHAHVA